MLFRSDCRQPHRHDWHKTERQQGFNAAKHSTFTAIGKLISCIRTGIQLDNVEELYEQRQQQPRQQARQHARKETGPKFAHFFNQRQPDDMPDPFSEYDTSIAFRPTRRSRIFQRLRCYAPTFDHIANALWLR